MAKRHYYKELRLQQFRALLEIQRRRTFTGAAEALGLSRTSVWQQIRSLEEEIGAELVVVRGQQPQLTDEGQMLVELAGPLLDGFDGIKPAFLDRVGRLHRRLIVATTTSLLNHELREPMAAYRRLHPEVTLNLVDRPSTAALELLRNGEADIAVIGRIERLDDEAMLRGQKLASYPFVLACPRRHPLEKKLARSVVSALAAAVEYPLVLPSVGTNARRRIDRVLGDAGLNGRVQLALDSNSASLLLTYVEQGLGVALTSISPELAEQFKKRVALIDLSSVLGEEEIVLVERSRRFPLPHVRQFVEIVTKHLQSRKSS